MAKSILFFHPHTSMGGTEHNMLRISKALVDLNFDIHFCVFEDYDIMFDSAKYFATSCTELGSPVKNPFRTTNNYYKLLKKIDPDVVLNFGLRVEVFSRIFSPILCRAKVLSNIRSTDVWRRKVHSLLDRMTKHRVSSWVSNSYAGKQSFVNREFLDPKKIDVIYNFIDPVPSRKENHTWNDVMNIGVLANIREVKGHKDLLKVSMRLTDLGIGHKFHLAGHDGLNGVLFEEIKYNNLEGSFQYHGYISDLSSFLPKMDCTVLPSYWEGLPTSVLESMSYGIPSIASGVGGVPEIITNGINGLIVEAGNIDSIVNQLLKLRDDLGLRERLSLEGYNTIKNKFGMKDIIKQWKDVLEK